MVGVRDIPQDYHSVNPYIVIANANEFILFLQSVFGTMKIKEVKGGVWEYHAEAKIGDTCIMIEEDNSAIYQKGTYFWVYVHDVTFIYEQALVAGIHPLNLRCVNME